MKFRCPMDTLPNDIAYEILRTAYRHTSFPYCGDHHLQQQIHSPISVSHVSRRWRELALSIPSLWSCVHFVQTQSRGDGALGQVEAYLCRSGQEKLSITFSCRTYTGLERQYSDGSRCPCSAVWNALLKERARWVGCVIETNTHIPVFAQGMSGNTFPHLRYLDLPTIRSIRSLQPFQITAPSLTQLRVKNHATSSILDSAPLELFSKLTTIELDVFRFRRQGHGNRFASILRSATATLEVLVLRNGRFELSEAPASLELMPASLPRLTFLVLDDITEEGDAANSILATLCRAAHALDRLYLNIQYSPSPLLHAYLFSGALRLLSVRFLRCNIPDIYLPNWNNFISAFPELVDLQVTEGDPSPVLHAAAWMDTASTQTGGSPAWPHLANLVLYGAHESIAIRFVQHRGRVGLSLSAVAYEGWLLIRTELIFAALNVTFVPLNRLLDKRGDYDRDWIKYWRIINGELPAHRRPIMS